MRRMSTLTFDTLDATRRLRDAGFDEKQAETVVRVLSDAQVRLVTSEHFDTRMQSLDAKLEAVELRLTIKLGAFLVVAVGVILTVLRLPH